MRKVLVIPVYLAILWLTGCTSISEWIPWVYRIDIDQGNIITQPMINQLQPGMNERQVRFIMGTPLLIDTFHDNRWNYLLREKPGDGAPTTQKKLFLYFKDGALVKVTGDFRPNNIQDLEPIQDTTVIVPKINREKTLSQKIKSWFGIQET